jgi:pfkB family carbohydrate kinase
MTNDMDVGILGRIGYDLYAEDHNVRLKDVRRFSRYLGGSSANMAVGLRRLGHSVGIISCVGTDPLSDYLKVPKTDAEKLPTCRFFKAEAGHPVFVFCSSSFVVVHSSRVSVTSRATFVSRCRVIRAAYPLPPSHGTLHGSPSPT